MRLSKGFSQIISSILLVILVILASSTLYILETDIKIGRPVFVKIKIVDITGEGENKFDNQIVILKHVGGDSIEVKNMRIHLTVQRENEIKSCILQEFPWKFGIGINNLSEGAIEGEDIIDLNPNHYSKYMGEISYKSDGVWSSGETVGFRIKKGSILLKEGDIIKVSIEYEGRIVAKDSYEVI